MSAFTGRPLALEAVFAFAMPWRAARTARELRRNTDLLIRVLNYAVTGGTEPLMRVRPDRSAWYDRPLPLAALAAALRPVRAVRRLRSKDDSVLYLLNAILAQHRRHDEELGIPAAARPRHLHAVR